MDKYILDIKRNKNSKNNNRITLFTFPPSNSIMTKDRNEYGWHELHDKVHISFVELAKENPEIEFVIKHKGVDWEVTKKLLNDIGAFDVNNLIIYGERAYDTHKLILESDVVTGFCSTALLEAAIAGKPIVYPLFSEANNEKYKDFICFSDALEMFDVATSNKKYKELLIKRIKNKEISIKIMQLRELQFEKHVSSLKANAIKKYSDLIISDVKTCNGYK
jgi:lipid A disaccharide synthetase